MGPGLSGDRSALNYLNSLCFRTKSPNLLGLPQLGASAVKDLFQTPKQSPSLSEFELFFVRSTKFNLLLPFKKKLTTRIFSAQGKFFFRHQLKKNLYLAHRERTNV